MPNFCKWNYFIYNTTNAPHVNCKFVCHLECQIEQTLQCCQGRKQGANPQKRIRFESKFELEVMVRFTIHESTTRESVLRRRRKQKLNKFGSWKKKLNDFPLPVNFSHYSFFILRLRFSHFTDKPKVLPFLVKTQRLESGGSW